jgi:predicted negative regulator of RcsB-dependent stress response
MQVQIRNAETGTAVASYETTPISSSLVQQTAFRLTVAAAESVQQHFKVNGAGRSFRPRPAGGRFREADAARAFAEGLNKCDELEYASALTALTNSAKIDDQHAMTHAWLSRVHLILSHKNEAVAAAQRARALVTGDLSKTDAAFIDAVLAESRGDLDAAETIYRDRAVSKADEPWLKIDLADFLKRRDANQRAVDRYHESLQSDPAFIRPHVELCQLYTRLSDHPLAQKEGQLALERYRAEGSKGGEAQALLCLGESQRLQGGSHLADARKFVDSARILIASLDQPYNLSRALYYEGLVDYSDGDLTHAAQWFNDASRESHAVGNKLIEGLALMNSGVVNYLVGHPTLSVPLYDQSRDLFLELGLERRVAEVDLDRLAIQVDFGSRPDEALKTLINAKANLEKLGYVDFQLVAMQSEADINRYAGHLAAARKQLQMALQIAKEKQLTSKISDLSLSLAQTEIQDNNYIDARKLLEPLLGGDSSRKEEASIALGTVLLRLGDVKGARAPLESALKSIEQQQSSLLTLAHSVLGELEYQANRAAAGRTHLTVAITSWTDALPNPASIEAQCDRGLQDLKSKRLELSSDLKRGVEQADRTGRLVLKALCRVNLAQAYVEASRFAEAASTLQQIPDDTDDQAIGRELRARVEFWKGLAAVGLRQTDGPASIGSAQSRLRTIQSSLPEEFRAMFATRSDIAPILSWQDVRSHP